MKRIAVLFLILAMAVPFLGGCSLSGDNTCRYALYVSSNQLFCFDAKSGETRSIGLQNQIKFVSDARVGDSTSKMFFEVGTVDGAHDIYYWDGTSDQADWVDRGGSLLKVSQDMQSCVYIKSESKNYSSVEHLYRYSTDAGITRLSDQDVVATAVSDDTSRIFYEESIAVGSTSNLYRISKDGIKTFIAQTVYKSGSVSSDFKSVGYLRYDGFKTDNDYYSTWPAYLWTEESGERALPFHAHSLCVMSENEIYYCTPGGDYYNHYFYDGTHSYKIGSNAAACSHNIGDYYIFHVKDTETGEVYDYMAYHKQSAPIYGRYCPSRGNTAGLSCDGKTVYSWKTSENTTYLMTSTVEDGQIRVTPAYETVEYSSRNVTFSGDTMLYTKDGTLYKNGVPVISDTDEHYLSTDGKTVVYRKGDCLYLDKEETADQIILDRSVNTVVILQSETVLMKDENKNLYMRNEENTFTLAGGVTDICEALPWSKNEAGNIVFPQSGKGIIFYAIGSLLNK